MITDRSGTCAIMQPSFLPWAGYFNLIALSEHFIFLTDAEFSKGSWHNRNQVIIEGKKLGLPVQLNEQECILHWIVFN